jgi:cytochrome P450
VREMIPIFNDKTDKLLENVAKMEGKGEFNIFYFMSALTLETIYKIMEFDIDIQGQKFEHRNKFIDSLDE